VGRGQLGPGGGDADVAVAAEGEPDAGRRSVDGGDDRLGDAEVVGQLSVELGTYPVAGPGRGVGIPRAVGAPFDVSGQVVGFGPGAEASAAPVTTMTRTPMSSDARCSSARYSKFIREVQALSRSGRSRVIVATCSATL